MKLIDHRLSEFVAAVDSSAPAPGGGSVSALSALLGVSLARMVGHLTIHKKAFAKLAEHDRIRFTDAVDRLGIVRDDLMPLIDKDTDAFDAVMAAFRLPKATELEQHRRQDAIQEATIGAIEVPLKVASVGMEALACLDVILTFGNKNAISDVGVAALQLQAGIQGALMNVTINLSMLSEDHVRKDYEQRIGDMEHTLPQVVDGLIARVKERL